MKGDCVVIDFVRTPLCAIGGALQSRTVEELARVTMQSIMDRTNLPHEKLDHVVFGHAHMDTAPYNLARTGWLLTRIDENVPGYTTHFCQASGLLALQKAYHMFRTGNDLTAIVGGAESYSNLPFVLRGARYRIDLHSSPVVDSIEEGELWTQPEPMNPRALAKALAEERGYTDSRIEATAEAARRCTDEAFWKDHLIPVEWKDRKGKPICVAHDAPGDTQNGFASYSDGAAAMLVMEAEQSEKLGYHAIASLLGFASAACYPDDRHTALNLAIQKLLCRFPGVTPQCLGAVELLAESAATLLAVTEDLNTVGIGAEIINCSGSTLSCGMNDGADGVIGLERCILNLTESHGQYGIVAVSGGAGQAMAALIAR